MKRPAAAAPKAKATAKGKAAPKKAEDDVDWKNFVVEEEEPANCSQDLDGFEASSEDADLSGEYSDAEHDDGGHESDGYGGWCTATRVKNESQAQFKREQPESSPPAVPSPAPSQKTAVPSPARSEKPATPLPLRSEKPAASSPPRREKPAASSPPRSDNAMLSPPVRKRRTPVQSPARSEISAVQSPARKKRVTFPSPACSEKPAVPSPARRPMKEEKRTRTKSVLIHAGRDETGRALPAACAEHVTPAQKYVFNKSMQGNPTLQAEYQKCMNMTEKKIFVNQMVPKNVTYSARVDPASAAAWIQRKVMGENRCKLIRGTFCLSDPLGSPSPRT